MALFRLHRKTWEKNTRPLLVSHSKPHDTTTPASNVPHKRPRTTSLSGPIDNSDLEGEDQGEEVIVNASPEVVRGGKKKGKAKAVESFPGGGRKGVSSGLSTVVKRVGAPASSKAKGKPKPKEKWWKDLGGTASSGSKGSLRLKVG